VIPSQQQTQPLFQNLIAAAREAFTGTQPVTPAISSNAFFAVG